MGSTSSQRDGAPGAAWSRGPGAYVVAVLVAAGSRRRALGVIRMLVERDLPLSLREMAGDAFAVFPAGMLQPVQEALDDMNAAGDESIEPGETLLSVSAGDTTRWIVGDAQSGIAGNIQSHILVKPNAANLATNLVIMTDRRVYHVELKSVAGPAMAAVSWRYPAELILQNQLPPQALTMRAPISRASTSS